MTPSTELLQRYLNNTCTDAERAVVDAWYQSLNLNSSESFTDSDRDRLLESLQMQIAGEDEVVETRTFPLKRLWLYAGGIAAMLLISIGLYYQFRQEPRLAPVAVAGETTIKYTNNQKKVIPYSLPDQTQIWLHPGASIAYSSAFTAKQQREVTFEGEAFFDVSRDTTRPFIIRSGTLITEVLGTSFNVVAYADQPDYRVSVVTGSVSVSAATGKKDADRIILKPHQQVIFEKSTSQMTLMDVAAKPTHYEAWQPVSMSFTNATLADIAERLQKTFRIRIKIDNPALRQCSLKADFDDQNLPEILEMINTLMGTTYEIEKDQIVISGEGCENP